VLRYRQSILKVPEIIPVRSEKLCLNPNRVTDRLKLEVDEREQSWPYDAIENRRI